MRVIAEIIKETEKAFFLGLKAATPTGGDMVVKAWVPKSITKDAPTFYGEKTMEVAAWKISKIEAEATSYLPFRPSILDMTGAVEH